MEKNNTESTASEQYKSVLSIFKEAFAKQLSTIANVPADQLLPMFDEAKSDDYLFSLALPKLKKFKIEETVADEYVSKFKPDEYLASVVKMELEQGKRKLVLLNFAPHKGKFFELTLSKVWNMKKNYGCSDEFKGKKIIVEYSSPNIAKPFHAGHLRSTIIGNWIKNVYKTLGADVTSINYLGDWGKQYGILAVAFARYGNEEELAKNPIRHLFDIYVKINADAEKEPEIHDQARAYFKRMEDGDAEALALWRKFRDMSIEEYKKIYARLNVHFDVYSGESFQTEASVKALDALKEKALLTESEKGGFIVDLSKFKLPSTVIQKKDGTTLYITRDLGAAATRQNEYQFDKMFYVVAAQQDLHFRQVFKLLELMGYDWVNKCEHINFGMVKGMSTRKGTVVFLEDMLNEAKEIMLEKMKADTKGKLKEIENPEKTADEIGLSAVVIQDLGAKRIKDYDFSWDRITEFEGHTGPYLQYAHARLCSMEDKNKEVKIHGDVDFSILQEKEALNLAVQIARYPEVLHMCLKNLEPSTLVTYLFELSATISAAHQHLYVKGQEQKVAEARALLFWAARIVLHNGLVLMGLNPQERM
eukprot:TRINITY_DN2607_c0_g1_i1.p1 TRINITY_DN2607_c0_g1~~TRINITY_DN2607_c0_g1_i1.p1  ORF type:complete len:590 (+),score=236.05 TRINITY_DN2607_c0_g1_i1:461-2230(+)